MSKESTQSVSDDAAFDLLSNARRRFVLRRLQEAGSGVDLGELATELSALENDIPADELSSKQRKRTYVSLYQTHVPKLEDAGIVAYDGDSGVVRPTESLDELAAYFRTNPTPFPWRQLYIGVSVVGLAVYAVAHVVDLQVVRPQSVGLAVLAAIALLSLTHYAYVRWHGRTTVTIPVERA